MSNTSRTLLIIAFVFVVFVFNMCTLFSPTCIINNNYFRAHIQGRVVKVDGPSAVGKQVTLKIKNSGTDTLTYTYRVNNPAELSFAVGDSLYKESSSFETNIYRGDTLALTIDQKMSCYYCGDKEGDR